MDEVIDGLTWILRILWACRVGVINVVSSCVLFWFAIQADDLMADLSAGGVGWRLLFWALVFVLTFLFWAFPVHYGARRTLAEEAWIISRATRDRLSPECRTEITRPIRRRFEWLLVALPRLLGLGPFVALAIGIHGALGSIGGAQVLDETSATTSQLYWLYAADAVTAAAFIVFVYLRRKWIPLDWDGRLLHPLALVGTAGIFVVAYVLPVWTSTHFPRAVLVPPLFGSLVLLTSWLARVAQRTGVPVLLGAFVLAGVLTATNAGFHDVRILADQTDDQRLPVAAAVEQWKKANSCVAGDCPHPIVVAIDGGASRAAFTAATFVGELLDHIRKVDGDELTPAPDKALSPGRRIFAISGVSGGAYGAAVIQSAIADGQSAGPSPDPPCRSARRTWFGFADWRLRKTFNWRECLQALTSGDALSPTIIGLAFRDFAVPPWQAIGLPAMADRAALLETTWERQYAATLTSKGSPRADPCDPGKPTGLCRPAAHPAAFFAAHQGGDKDRVWMPMLMLNGTSVTTGRRIVSADLKSEQDAKALDGGAIFPQAYDLREAVSAPCPGPVERLPASAYPITTLAQETHSAQAPLFGICLDEPPQQTGRDVRLSTAAMSSARFPVISPAGIFGMGAARYGDQVVDGGYFENSGLTTALEIVAALRAAHVEPILVSISNNPEYDNAAATDLEACASTGDAAEVVRSKLAGCAGLPQRRAPTPLVSPADNTFLGRLLALVTRPLQALYQTGSGHADEAMGRAAAVFPLSEGGGFFRLKVEVAPIFKDGSGLPLADDPRCRKVAGKTLDMAKVSMSWWLSAAVQADLDIQRCSLANQEQLLAIENKLKTRDAMR